MRSSLMSDFACIGCPPPDDNVNWPALTLHHSAACTDPAPLVLAVGPTASTVPVVAPAPVTAPAPAATRPAGGMARTIGPAKGPATGPAGPETEPAGRARTIGPAKARATLGSAVRARPKSPTAGGAASFGGLSRPVRTRLALSALNDYVHQAGVKFPVPAGNFKLKMCDTCKVKQATYPDKNDWNCADCQFKEPP
jgi:hypothetical protein